MKTYQRELAELENLRGLRIDDIEQENWSALIAIPAPSPCVSRTAPKAKRNLTPLWYLAAFLAGYLCQVIIYRWVR